jgi:hypothetical protein
MNQAFPVPTLGHAAEAFLIAHAAPCAWSAGTAVRSLILATPSSPRSATMSVAPNSQPAGPPTTTKSKQLPVG